MKTNKDYYNENSWIKVERFIDDESLSWEERFIRLKEHHEKETKFLIDEVRHLAKRLDESLFTIRHRRL